VKWVDVLVGGHFTGYHGGEVVDCGMEFLIVLAELGEWGVDGG